MLVRRCIWEWTLDVGSLPANCVTLLLLYTLQRLLIFGKFKLRLDEHVRKTFVREKSD